MSHICLPDELPDINVPGLEKNILFLTHPQNQGVNIRQMYQVSIRVTIRPLREL